MREEERSAHGWHAASHQEQENSHQETSCNHDIMRDVQ
jgi:hypothetical protein